MEKGHAEFTDGLARYICTSQKLAATALYPDLGEGRCPRENGPCNIEHPPERQVWTWTSPGEGAIQRLSPLASLEDLSAELC